MEKIKFSLFYATLIAISIGTIFAGFLLMAYDISIKDIFLCYLGLWVACFMLLMLIDYND